MKLSEVAEALGGELVGDGSIEIVRAVHPAEAESAADLALAMDKRLAEALNGCKARAAVLAEGAAIPDGRLDGYILVKRPRYAMAGVTRLFDMPVHAPEGIHPSAVVEPDAEVAKDVRIGPFAYVASGAVVAAGTVLMSHVTVGAGARIGPDSLLHAGARIGERVEIGARAIIHQNASIGADGFSFVTPDAGAAEEARSGASDSVTAQNVVLTRINSIGTVIIGDDVEIGACTSIDRGTISATRIGNCTKIDDLVMIGHNVEIGENCMICGQAGIAGSTRIGSRVVLAGQVGVGDHLTIGDDVVVGARSAVGTNLPSRMVAIGTPAVARSKAAEIYMYTRRLKGLFDEVGRLKTRLTAIESGKKKG
ncbi:MAG: UDP-3-O-(3-hydroxymyristoyl)glucosamine N-acyltransferase [Alphaproteobacteria bacterium]|nr:UDP-3-O-(3-hydroxymyristoyl)glucosamine N-acyltransferase [Alphaproteobacteria bacterium]